MSDTTQNKAGQRDLTQGAIPLTMILFALPTLGSSVLQSLNGSINAIWVGRFLGADALAATTNGNIVMFLLVSFVFGFGMAATILIGQAVGRHDGDLAKRVFGTAMGSIIPFGILIAVFGWFAAPMILNLLETPAGAEELALTYLRVIFVAMPATLTFTLLMMALRGAGDSVTPLWFMGLSVMIDLGLNPALILGLGPLPQLGIFGSALSTVIANSVALGGMLITMYWRGSPLVLRRAELHYLLPSRKILTSMVTKGLPMGLQMIVVASAALTMLSLINREGVQTTAAYGATQQLWTYIQMPAMALSSAASAMAAQNIGAGKWDRVGAVTKWGLIYNVCLTGVMIVLLTLFDKVALGLFLDSGSAAIPIGRHIQLLATWGYLFFGVAMVLFGTMRANGYVIGPLIIMIIAMFPVRLGFAYGLEPVIGANALWLSFPVGMVATALMASRLYWRGTWRAGKMVPEGEAVHLTESLHPHGGSCPTGKDVSSMPVGAR
ncbi:putative MATE family efflux protein [Primorskyibacter sedentarius]|uniref:Putative MATE family efflux protein n=1 Tax=Primorskyibacter sedentarius TaxID=745311 RepID=A0A4R3IW31_9RHOB|nr:MATE family efflux transporter [Primorskyibacter sedentarius]TCS54486.1 putative MATE family efflux protein [Primorskyibacter sedentarius]